MMKAKRKPARSEPSELALVFHNSVQLSQLTAEKVAVNLRTNLTMGLSAEEVKWRTMHYGTNEVTMKRPEPKWKKFLLNFREPLIVLLLLSAAVSFILQNYKDGASITISVLLVVIVAFIQEARSEKSLQALKRLMPPTCTAFRNGEAVSMLAMDLVPGDIVILTLGDRVPADLRIFESVQLTVDESNFTGEAIPVPKTTMIHERTEKNKAENKIFSNLAFMGTLVVAGSGRGIVANCGDKTEFGEIVRMVQDEQAPITPLRRSMSVLGIQLTFLAAFVIILIAIIGIIQGRSLHNVFNISVSLAVAAIPEGLPIVVTVTLALGVIRMAKRNVIVKKLPAVETLGCVNVICSDKTGTLTKNEMTVAIILDTEGAIADISGTGYSTDGRINIRGGPSKSRVDAVYRILEIGVICNNAQIVHGDQVIGRPTEGALVVAGIKNNMQNVFNQYERVDEQPFSSETKIMIVTCVRKDDAERKPIYFMKGATDVVLQHCTLYMYNDTPTRMTKEKSNELLTYSSRLGMQGLRVLAMARGNSMDSLTYCGSVGITDPPRPLIRRAIRLITDSGARVIMLTGDARETAISIAHQIGMDTSSDRVMPGYKLDDMDDEKCEKVLRHIDVFYRVTPRHKLIIVKALQRSNYIVAMTGDGVNDSVALKKADIGIAMGKNGTDVCKEVADMVIIDDNFQTIVSAIEEGKSIFYNIRNFVRFQMTISMAALTLVAICFFMNKKEPLTTTQILWINIIMDGPPAQSLALEPVDHDVMTDRPRDPKKSMVTRLFIINVVLDAMFIALLAFLIYQYERRHYDHTTMTFTGFVILTLFHALACRSYFKSFFALPPFANRCLLITLIVCASLQMIVVYTPGVQIVFDTDNLLFTDLLIILGGGVLVLAFSEIKKFGIRTLRDALGMDRLTSRPPFPGSEEVVTSMWSQGYDTDDSITSERSKLYLAL